jgi:hypothetical protein
MKDNGFDDPEELFRKEDEFLEKELEKLRQKYKNEEELLNSVEFAKLKNLSANRIIKQVKKNAKVNFESFSEDQLNSKRSVKNLLIYGVHSPTAIRRHFIHLVLITLVFFFWGWHSDFVPSQSWSVMGWRVSLVIGILETLFVWWVYSSGRAQFKENTSSAAKTLFYVLVPFLCVGLTWGALVHGVSSFVNRINGHVEEINVNLAKVQPYKSGRCRYRLIGDYLEAAFPSYMCINQTFFEGHLEDGVVTLRGYKTQGGFLIDEIHEQKQLNRGVN